MGKKIVIKEDTQKKYVTSLGKSTRTPPKDSNLFSPKNVCKMQSITNDLNDISDLKKTNIIMKRKIIYITGALGFIGSHVTRLLLKKGHYIRAVDKLTYAANIDLLEEFNQYKNFTFQQIDICDLK